MLDDFLVRALLAGVGLGPWSPDRPGCFVVWRHLSATVGNGKQTRGPG